MKRLEDLRDELFAMKYVIVANVRGRWVWLRVVRMGSDVALKQPYLEWDERVGATTFESMPEAQLWAPPGSSIVSETWEPKSARIEPT